MIPTELTREIATGRIQERRREADTAKLVALARGNRRGLTLPVRQLMAASLRRMADRLERRQLPAER
jgi:hypothetical protein